MRQHRIDAGHCTGGEMIAFKLDVPDRSAPKDWRCGVEAKGLLHAPFAFFALLQVGERNAVS